jgi:hypothetical protein
MAEVELRALDPEVSQFSQEAAQLGALMEKICAELRVDHGKGLRALIQCLSEGYTFLFPALRQLAQNGPEEARRALVRAAAEAADPADPFRAPFLLEILAPLLFDPIPEIRRAARRALRERLIPVYPEEAGEVLVQWAAEADPSWKALAGQMLGYLPQKWTRRALIALKHLAHSEEKNVRRAVATALKRLLQQSPELVKAELQRWLEDPALSPLALRVLVGKEFPQSKVP